MFMGFVQMSALFEIFVALIVSNLYEWIAHKYILHGLGKKKSSFFYFHWAHHKNTRKHGGYDSDYEHPKESLKEVLLLLLLVVANMPLFWLFPVAATTMTIYSFVYYFAHRKLHLDVQWGKKWMPWHFDHHMGKNQDLNWCVVFPLWDHILGTRKKDDKKD